VGSKKKKESERQRALNIGGGAEIIGKAGKETGGMGDASISNNCQGRKRTTREKRGEISINQGWKKSCSVFNPHLKHQ